MSRRLLVALASVSALAAQTAAIENAALSTAEVERDALELFSLNRFERAVTLLERAAAASPSDIRVASLLGTAYICSSSGVGRSQYVSKARTSMEKAIEGGGEAIFLVSKARPQSRFTRGPSMLEVTPGELRISRESLAFVPSRDGEKKGPFRREHLKECGLNSGWGKDSNAFHIKSSNETLDFRPLHFSKEESDLACELAEKYLGVKRTK